MDSELEFSVSSCDYGTHIVLTVRISKAADSALSLLLQARITLAPLFASSRAVALPMPVSLPVQGKPVASIKLSKTLKTVFLLPLY